MKEKVKKFVNGKINYELEHDAPKDFVISQWQTKEKSAAFVIYRWLLANLYLFSFIFSFCTSIARGELKVHFIYLTNWCMLANLVCCVLGAVLATLHYFKRLKTNKMSLPLKTYWFLSISSTMYAILISFTYWAILYWKDDNTIDTNNVIIHMTNCLLVIDILVVKHKWNLAQFVWPLAFGCVFLAFSFVYPHLGGLNRRNQDYIYPILNWKASFLKSILSSLSILALGATIHCMLVFMHHARIKIHESIMAKKYRTVPVNSKEAKDVEAAQKVEALT